MCPRDDRTAGAVLGCALALSVLLGPRLGYAGEWSERVRSQAQAWELLQKGLRAQTKEEWGEAKASLRRVLDEFGGSEWADDAALLLAVSAAASDNDAASAMASLQEVVKTYPHSGTLVLGWRVEPGIWYDCAVAQAISDQLRKQPSYQPGPAHVEMLAYAVYQDEHPWLTRDVARLFMASLLAKSGETGRSASVLEAIVAQCRDIAELSEEDCRRGLKFDGYLVRYAWRPEYVAYLMLMDCYDKQGHYDRAIAIARLLAHQASKDGRFWKRINWRVGDLCARHGRWAEAAEQYAIALEGCKAVVFDRRPLSALIPPGTAGPDPASETDVKQLTELLRKATAQTR